MNFKMKTTMFKVFATCIATLCITLPVPSRAAPVLSSVPVKSEEKDENPIIKQHLDKKPEILDGLKFVDLNTFDSELITNEVLRELAIAVHEQMMASREFHRQRRSFDPEEEKRLSKEVESKITVPLMPPKSNADENSQQSNENEEDGEVHELPDPPSSSEQDNSVHKSNESDHPQESNESNNPRESNEPNNPKESNELNNPQESNESNNPHESNEPNNPKESNEPNNPQESNESNNPQESNEPNNPKESNEPNNPQESNESDYPPDTKSYEFDTGPENDPDNNDDEGDDPYYDPHSPLQKV